MTRRDRRISCPLTATPCFPTNTCGAERIQGHRHHHAASQRQSEQQIHRAVVQHLRQRGVPGLVWWHTPNGGERSKIEGAIFKGMGLRAGVSDLVLVHDGRIFALELKAKGGRASEAQLDFLAGMESAGAFTALAEGLDRAIRTLEAWGLLRDKAS
jgi:hypothetical protein